MHGFSTELIYVLIFGAILLLQYVMKRLGQQEPQESAQDERLPQIPEEVKETPAASVSRASVDQLGRPEAQGVSPRLTRRRYSRRLLMGTRREVQNAIVIATIVGPCRAFEPHDVR